jgi:release factor glutamine methyltransferase
LIVRNALASAAARLRDAGVGSPELDAALLLADTLGVSRTRLSLEPEAIVDAADAARFDDSVARRAQRRPISHLRGRQEFWSLEFLVTPDVLTPRPETEMLVELAAEHLRGACATSARPTAVDVGTGSGCVAVALAVEVPEARVLAVDVSGRALAVARENVRRHGVGERVEVRRGDLLAGVDGYLDRHVDVALSNPPYVRRSEAGSVDAEVLWEPSVAVFCDGPPERLYARIASDAAALVRPGGLLLLELPGRASEPVVEAVRVVEGWSHVTTLPDLAGLPRVLRAVRAA